MLLVILEPLNSSYRTQFQCHVLSEASRKHPLQQMSPFCVPARLLLSFVTSLFPGLGSSLDPGFSGSGILKCTLNHRLSVFLSRRSGLSKYLLSEQMSSPKPGPGSLGLPTGHCGQVDPTMLIPEFGNCSFMLENF